MIYDCLRYSLLSTLMNLCNARTRECSTVQPPCYPTLLCEAARQMHLEAAPFSNEYQWRLDMKRFVLPMIFAVVLGMAGCSSQAVDDSAITVKVKSKLAADSKTSAIKIGV